MMMNDYEPVKAFTFWDSWNAQCELMEDADRLAYMDAIRRYAFTGTLPSQNDVSLLVWIALQGAIPSINTNIRNRDNGKKGGAPKGNQNACKNKKQPVKQPPLFSENNPPCFEKTTPKTTNKNLEFRIQNSELEQQNLEFKNNECIDDRESVGKDRGLRGEGKPERRFTPPSSDDVAEWLWAEKGMAMTEAGPLADRFVSFYESKGWMVGKNKMKSWKAAISGWIARDKQECEKKQAEAFGASDGILYLKQVVGDV
jgi:hypothetical protein